MPLNPTSSRDEFLAVLQSASENTERILAEGSKFLKGLTKEEMDEIIKAYKDKT